MITRNSVIAVCTPLTVVSRSSLMSVIITFMFEPAKLQMNWASASGRINIRGETTGRTGIRTWPAATGFSLTRRQSNREQRRGVDHQTEPSIGTPRSCCSPISRPPPLPR